MKLPISKSTRRCLLWGFGLSVVHIAATFALGRLYYWSHGFGVPDFLLDYRVPIAREFAVTGLVLLHLPAQAVNEWYGEVSAPIPGLLWAFVAGDALLYGFGLATIVHWLRRPPRFFSQFALPLFTRRIVALALLLAVAHVIITALVYFGFRCFEGASGPTAVGLDELATALVVLHPWLVAFPLRPYASTESTVIAVALLDALVWGFAAAWATALVRRLWR